MLDCRVARVGRWTTTDDATARLVRFSGIYTEHQQTTTCFKIDFFPNFFEFFSRNFKMRGDGNHDDRHNRHDDEQV
jgi:hypothetical protein